MYIWMVIAAFIGMFYAFNLSYRADIRNVAISPRAESTIDKLVLQHRAAEFYARDRVLYEKGSREVQFNQGVIVFNDLQPYLPYGFENNGEYTSAIYCMDRNSEGLSLQLGCNEYYATVYVITYGCINARWKSLSGGKPNNDLMNAMKKIVRSGTSFGYSVEADPNDSRNSFMKSPMAIQGHMNNWTAIPQYIVNSDGGIGGNSFKTQCNGNKNCDYCLVYMTPFN